ncbi:hypothetical protein [Phyllobacterium sp. K27]
MSAKSFLKHNIRWMKTEDVEVVYTAVAPDGSKLAIRLNDFPAEPLYTLLCDAAAIESFDDWPQSWRVDLSLAEFHESPRL